ncbi:elastin-like [Herpailurus yagouaroundi]|uniref:elastin-like n=1 Tax=Herpailurus yagouaroundi TaxID=1608482 RepID=UPI001AD7CF5F|nr:elastin-like [Puma yagouaroundi]
MLGVFVAITRLGAWCLMQEPIRVLAGGGAPGTSQAAHRGAGSGGGGDGACGRSHRHADTRAPAGPPPPAARSPLGAWGSRPRWQAGGLGGGAGGRTPSSRCGWRVAVRAARHAGAGGFAVSGLGAPSRACPQAWGWLWWGGDPAGQLQPAPHPSPVPARGSWGPDPEPTPAARPQAWGSSGCSRSGPPASELLQRKPGFIHPLATSRTFERIPGVSQDGQCGHGVARTRLWTLGVIPLGDIPASHTGLPTWSELQAPQNPDPHPSPQLVSQVFYPTVFLGRLGVPLDHRTVSKSCLPPAVPTSLHADRALWGLSQTGSVPAQC